MGSGNLTSGMGCGTCIIMFVPWTRPSLDQLIYIEKIREPEDYSCEGVTPTGEGRWRGRGGQKNEGWLLQLGMLLVYSIQGKFFE